MWGMNIERKSLACGKDIQILIPIVTFAWLNQSENDKYAVCNAVVS